MWRANCHTMFVVLLLLFQAKYSRALFFILCEKIKSSRNKIESVETLSSSSFASVSNPA
jgi:hypothetical protein